MTSISEHTNPKDYNWYWKILNELKYNLRAWYKHRKYNLTTGGNYYILKSYLAMSSRKEKVDVPSLIWKTIAEPKHRFIIWLATKESLLTKRKLLQPFGGQRSTIHRGLKSGRCSKGERYRHRV